MAVSKTRERAELLLAACALAVFVTVSALLGLWAGWDTAEDAVPTVDIATDEALELVGARGDEVRFTIVTHGLGEERWRSDDGIGIVIGGRRHEVVGPRDKDWGEALSRSPSQGNDPVEIRARFLVPDAPGAGDLTLRGRLSGDLTVAVLSGSGTFSNASRTADNPVVVRVVSVREAEAERRGRRGPGERMMRIALWIAAAAALLAILSGLGSWWLYRRG